MSNFHSFDVSVVVPVFNMANYVRECLESILKQRDVNLEVLVFNDGSTDNSLSIIKEFEKKDIRVKVIDQPNKGVAFCRNSGIRLSQGRYIFFLDPDDLLPEQNTLSKLFIKASQNAAKVCGGSFSVLDGEVINSTFEGVYSGYTFKQEGFISYISYQFDFGFHRFIYHREFLLENSIFFPPLLRYQDPPFFAKCLTVAQSFYAIPDTTYIYREGHKKVSWDHLRINDMLKGVILNLALSNDNKFEKLFKYTVSRVNEKFSVDSIVSLVSSGNHETLSLLLEVVSLCRKASFLGGEEVLVEAFVTITKMLTEYGDLKSENQLLKKSFGLRLERALSRRLKFITQKF